MLRSLTFDLHAQGEVHWERLLSLVLMCKSNLEDTKPHAQLNVDHSAKLGAWLATVRLDGVGLSEVDRPHPSDHQRLSQLVASIGMADIDPAHILVAAEAGSHLYNLTLPTSDTDYIIIYRHPTHSLISSVSRIKVSYCFSRMGGGIDLLTSAWTFTCTLFTASTGVSR